MGTSRKGQPERLRACEAFLEVAGRSGLKRTRSGEENLAQGVFSCLRCGVIAMTSEIESACERLQAILSELEYAYADGESFGLELLREMHSLTQFVHENGFNVATVRQDSKVLVEIEPFAVREYDWAA
jgi:hypothetical protein